MGYLRGSAPEFRNAQGQPISSIVCGQPYTFDVPGYNMVWLEQAKNGAMGYNGPIAVPMNPYTANCTTEVASYWNTVYEYVNGQKGKQIGQVNFEVRSAPAAAPPIISSPAQSLGPNVTLTINPQTGVPTATAAPAGGSAQYIPVPDASGPSVGPVAPPADSSGLYIGLALVAVLFATTRR